MNDPTPLTEAQRLEASRRAEASRLAARQARLGYTTPSASAPATPTTTPAGPSRPKERPVSSTPTPPTLEQLERQTAALARSAREAGRVDGTGPRSRFVLTAQAKAKAEGTSVTAAMRQLAREQPELFNEHKRVSADPSLVSPLRRRG